MKLETILITTANSKSSYRAGRRTVSEVDISQKLKNVKCVFYMSEFQQGGKKNFLNYTLYIAFLAEKIQACVSTNIGNLLE